MINELREYKNEYERFSNSQLVDQLNFGLKRPNIFEILKISSAEIRHSNFLSWLLDPTAGHGLGPLFLQKILRKVFSDDKSANYDEFYVDEINFNKIEIHREWKHHSSGQRNSLDILIKHPEFIVAIENKIWSKDAVSQLKNYKEMIEECFPDYLGKCVYVYLTPEGSNTNDKEIAKDYILLSYKTIIDFLKNLIEVYQGGISTAVTLYITDYITILSRELMGEEELATYAKKIYKTHKDLLDFVYKYGKTDAFREAFDVFIDEEQYDKTSSKANNGIYFIPISWKDYLIAQKKISKNEVYPIMILLEYYPKSSGKTYNIKMGVQVQPFKEEYKEERSKILDSMKMIELTKKPLDSTQYTTLIAKIEEIDDIQDFDKILSTMKSLSTKFQDELKKIENALKQLSES